MSNILDEITMVPFPEDQYIRQESAKRLIFLHHTASSSDPYSVVNWWKHTPERVATSFIIAGESTSDKWKDGEIIQIFSSKYWAYHLGLTAKHLAPAGKEAKSSLWLNKHSIGLEICAWGQLVYKNGKYYAYPKDFTSVTVPEDQVVEYPDKFRGYQFYQKYTPAQIESVRKLLLFLGDRWDIPLKYNDKIFTYPDLRAMRGEPCVAAHVGVRNDKFDVSPQPLLVEMLKSL